LYLRTVHRLLLEQFGDQPFVFSAITYSQRSLDPNSVGQEC